MIRGVLIILFALFIDGLQAGVSAGFLMLGSFAGTIGGAAAGAAACQGAGTLVAGACATVAGAAGTLVNAHLAVIGVPLAVGFGIAVNICISLTMGSELIMLLALNGMFNARYVVGVFIGEAIPGLDNLPGWTFLAIKSVLKKSAKSGTGISSFAAGVAGMALSPASPLSAINTLRQGVSAARTLTGPRQTQPNVAPPMRPALSNKNFEGVRKPANDNRQQTLQPYAQAA